jgi:hypothetical protein
MLRTLIEEVTAANGRRYGVTDDVGRPMHCAKIIEDRAAEDAIVNSAREPYLAVYHSVLSDGRFHVALAASADLLHWRHVRDFGPGGSQPTIASVDGGDGGYLLAWEQDPKNHIALRYFADRAALFDGPPSRSFDARRSLSRHAEGTPNIYFVQLSPDIDRSVITLGGHYWWKGKVDRQLLATLTDFKHWKAERRRDLDASLLHWGVRGNIGGRDPLVFLGLSFAVIEGQHAKGDFGTWRTYVCDNVTGAAWPAQIQTDAGSTAFANPHVTALTGPDGRRALAVSLFLPGEGAARGEGGQLIYWRAY